MTGSGAGTGPERSVAWGNGAAYEPYVGRWSRLVARDFIAWLAVRPGESWLDVGCGTGALSASILAQAAPQRWWELIPQRALSPSRRNRSASRTSGSR